MDDLTSDADTPDRSSLRVRPSTRELCVEWAGRLGYTADEFVEIAVLHFLDRAATGFHVDSAYLIRETQHLELCIEQLTIASLGLQETLGGLEAGGLKSLIQLATIARDQAQSAAANSRRP